MMETLEVLAALATVIIGWAIIIGGLVLGCVFVMDWYDDRRTAKKGK